MRTFREVFTEYGGDYDVTMERFMGSEEMYLRLLDMLFQDRSLEALEKALAAGELREGFDAAHTLKGVVANMGLTPLLDAVCAVVEPLRAGEEREEYPDLLRKIREEFQKVEELRVKLQETAGEK